MEKFGRKKLKNIENFNDSTIVNRKVQIPIKGKKVKTISRQYQDTKDTNSNQILDQNIHLSHSINVD